MSSGLNEIVIAPPQVQTDIAASKSVPQNETSEIVSSPQDQDDDERRVRHYKILYRAALKGDWNTARDIYEEYPDYITAKLSKEGDTALHIAAGADSSKFALNLLDRMNPEDLAIKNQGGYMAFSLVAGSGKLELARAMLRKNPDFVQIGGIRALIGAALYGYKEMVALLHDEMKELDLEENDRTTIFHYLIRTGFYDVALDLLKTHPELATVSTSTPIGNLTALHFLALNRPVSSSFANQNENGIWKRCFNLLSGSNDLCHKKQHPRALNLVKCLWEQIDLDASWIWEIIFFAAEKGNIEFLNIIIRDYPALILKANHDNRSIFHIAVLNRQRDIFKLIYELSPLFKNTIAAYKDIQGNNMLHMVGMLAPVDRLNTVSGVALQLQQELLWFEEVSKIVHPFYVEDKNNEGKTPKALFTEKHGKLKEDGEKWMKDTANSCMIVATLIATVIFAAAFTIPGGNKDDTGTPHFIKKVSFITFIISDVISLVSSSCSILTFLSILTSRYAEEDFLSVLPRKLVVGLSTLFLSIAAMMVVFCSTIFIVFKDEMIWVPILVSVIASLPVIVFTKQQWQLLFDVVRSTFKISSLSQKSEHALFDDEKEKTRAEPEQERTN